MINRTASESRTAIYVGLGANVLIAATRFAGVFATVSSAMVAESMHSLVDAGDGGLLHADNAPRRDHVDRAVERQLN